jgi:hypothetical protein
MVSPGRAAYPGRLTSSCDCGLVLDEEGWAWLVTSSRRHGPPLRSIGAISRIQPPLITARVFEK